MIKFINLNQESKETLSFKEDGQYVVFFHNLSGKFVFELEREGINVEIYGLFTGKDKDEFKINTIQHHKAPGATSNLLIKGVFNDSSRFLYEGLIRIEHEAQQSHAYQKNQNLILSPKTYVESKPYLEILANDVFCTHGSTTGKLNADHIFYLQTRSIAKEQAEQLLIDGFIAEIADKIRSKVPNFQLMA